MSKPNLTIPAFPVTIDLDIQHPRYHCVKPGCAMDLHPRNIPIYKYRGRCVFQTFADWVLWHLVPEPFLVSVTDKPLARWRPNPASPDWRLSDEQLLAMIDESGIVRYEGETPLQIKVRVENELFPTI